MYVIQISPSGARERIYLDPDSKSPVYYAFSECPGTFRLTFESRHGITTYERTE